MHDRMLFVYDIYGLDYECAAMNVQLACARSVCHQCIEDSCDGTLWEHVIESVELSFISL